MKVVYLFVITFLLCCCNDMRLKDSLNLLYSKKIEIPTNLRTTYNGKDSLMNEMFENKFKLIVYFDSTGCSSCNISKMYMWKPLLKYVEKNKRKIEVFFIFYPAKNKIGPTITTLLSNPIDYPILLDTLGEFEKLNPHLPKNRALHTFLLDENNKVILVGSPLHNKRIEEMFYKVMEDKLGNLQ